MWRRLWRCSGSCRVQSSRRGGAIHRLLMASISSSSTTSGGNKRDWRRRSTGRWRPPDPTSAVDRIGLCRPALRWYYMQNSPVTPDLRDQPLLDALLDSWDRNNAIVVNLLRALPPGSLELRAMEGSPSIAELFTH